MFCSIIKILRPQYSSKIKCQFCRHSATVVTPSVSESAIDDTSRGVSPSSQTPVVSSVHVTVPSAQSDGVDFKTGNQLERTRQEANVSIFSVNK